MSLATKMSASKLIHYFSSHPAAFGFWTSTPPDNVSLNSANRKADQSLLDFQTGVGATAHATLDTEQLISYLWVALVDTLSSLPEAKGDVIPVSEVHELLLQIHDILDKAVSKQVRNSTCILAHLFNSVSRQCCEVWASQFPCLHSLKEVFLLVRLVCMALLLGLWYRLILWVCLSLFLLRGVARLDHELGPNSQYRRRPLSGCVPGTSGASLPKRPHLESGTEAHLSGKKSAGGSVSTSSAESRRKGGHGGWCS